MTLTIAQLQKEQAEWAERNFPDGKPHQPLLGMVEELGELAHAQLKGEQGIRGTAEQHEADGKDAVADFVIYLVDYCTRVGFDLGGQYDDRSFQTIQDRFPNPQQPLAGTITYLSEFIGGLDEGDTHNLPHKILLVITNVARYCTLRNWNLQEIMEETWAEVSQRDWQANPETGIEDRPILMEPTEAAEDVAALRSKLAHYEQLNRGVAEENERIKFAHQSLVEQHQKLETERDDLTANLRAAIENGAADAERIKQLEADLAMAQLDADAMRNTNAQRCLDIDVLRAKNDYLYHLALADLLAKDNDNDPS